MTNNHQDCAEHYYGELLEEKEAHFREVTLRNAWVIAFAATLLSSGVLRIRDGLDFFASWYLGWGVIIMTYAVVSLAVHYGRRSENKAAQLPEHTCQDSGTQTAV